MLQFILTDLVMISLGAIVIVVLRAIPKIEPEISSEKKNIFERWIGSEIPEKFDLFLNNVLFKFFKKMKVWLLKIDNTLTARLKRMKPTNGDATKPDFSEIMNGNSTNVAKSDELGDTEKES